MKLASLAGTSLLCIGCVVRVMAQGVLDFGSTDNFNQVRHWQHGGIYYSGRVAVPGGLLPWEPIQVIVTCNGVTRMNTQTDEKGEFRLEPPPTDSEMGVSGNDPKRIAPASLAGCKVHAEMAGFQSSTCNITNNSMMDDPDIGTITLKRDESSTGAAVSATTFAAAPELQKEFAQARSEAISHHPDAAQRLLQKIVIADPNFAEAWYQLGRVQEKKSPQDALNSFDKAVAADPDLILTYAHMAAVQALQKNWEASLTTVRRALKHDPQGSPQLWYFSALANLNLNQLRFAEASARTSLAMDPSHLAPNTEQLLAVILARRGDYAGALEHLRSSLSYISPGPNADLIKTQIAQIEKAQTTAAVNMKP